MDGRNNRRLLRGGVIAVVVAVAAALVVVGVARGLDRNTARGGFCADMPDAVGLYVGNPVTQMGVRLGTIEQIEPRGDTVRVGFAVDEARPIPAGVRAVTRAPSLLADRSLELVGNYEAGARLEPGECIGAENSFTPQTISQITSSAAEFIDALVPEGSSDLSGAISGLDRSLQGSGENIRSTLDQAATALRNPDRLISDLGAAITNMAPLSEASLEDWDAIRTIVKNMPMVLREGIDLWPGVIDTCVGIGWLVATLYSVQHNFGSEISMLLEGPVTQAIRLAAARAPDLKALADTIPAVAGSLQEQSGSKGFALRYKAPAVSLPSSAAKVVCPPGNGVCRTSNGTTTVPMTALLSLVAGGAR